MKREVLAILCLTLLALSSSQLAAQKTNGSDPVRPLILTETIPLENVKGRYDGVTAGAGRLFVSARGNNTLEVVDLGARTQGRSIHVPDPTGVAYSPETKKIFVASAREGKVYVFDGTSYELIAAVDFGGYADGLRYDGAAKRVYVSFGDGPSAGIGVIDVVTNQRLQDYKLGSHPEHFELEKSGPIMYVNLPDDKQVAVVNRDTRSVTRWNLPVEMNFPLALNEADHRLYIATMGRARFLALDTDTGRVVANLPCVQGSDDMFYDAKRKRIYIPGMEGYVSVFQQVDPDHYQLLENVPSEIGIRGGAYPPVSGKGFDRFYLAAPAAANRSAEILIYMVQD